MRLLAIQTRDRPSGNNYGRFPAMASRQIPPARGRMLILQIACATVPHPPVGTCLMQNGRARIPIAVL